MLPRWTAPAAGVVAVGMTAFAGAARSTDEQQLLRAIGFSSAEIQRIARGETVARTTQADSSAVALAVASTIATPLRFYIEQLRAIETFKKSPEVLQIGRFTATPDASQMAALTLEPSDVNDLRSCRPGDCGLKLDDSGIAALASKEARVDTASAAMRQYLAAYAQSYLRGGNAALIQYHDAAKPNRLLDDLRLILDESAYLREGWPQLFRGVAHFSGTLPTGLDGFVYWSKEKIGPRAVVSLTQVVISPPADGRAAIATKQIYATHYGHASLGLTILLDRSTAAGPSTRVIYVNRSRLDIFGGLFGGIKRSLVRSRARDGAERTMRRLRERLESSYRAAASGRI